VSRPAAGTRYVVELTDGGAPDAALYRGFVHLPDASLGLEVRVELPGGATSAVVAGAAPGSAELERMAAALVRSATKPAVAGGTALPRKIVRWRG
jgi:hypothetical protein